MNPWQMAQQIKAELQAVTWPEGSGEVVFGDRSVLVHAGTPPAEDAVLPGFPFALVIIDAGEADESAPEFIAQQFTIVSVAEVAGDPMGEHAVIGGPRADLGSSAGAGVAEIASRVRSAVQDLTGIDGARVQLSASSMGALATLGRGRHLAYDELVIEGLCTSDEHYAEPQELAVSGSEWTWTGSHCTSRFDFLQFRLGYVAGSTPVSDPDDLDATVGTTTSTTFEHSPTGGRAYSIFAEYDARGTGSRSGHSDGSLVGAFTTT